MCAITGANLSERRLDASKNQSTALWERGTAVGGRRSRYRDARLPSSSDSDILRTEGQQSGAREHFKIAARHGEIYGQRWRTTSAKMRSCGWSRVMRGARRLATIGAEADRAIARPDFLGCCRPSAGRFRAAAPRWRSRRRLWHPRFPFAKLSKSLPFLVSTRVRLDNQAQN
jgi:hypothetical protein